jgi:hypothetical protein
LRPPAKGSTQRHGGTEKKLGESCLRQTEGAFYNINYFPKYKRPGF